MKIHYAYTVRNGKRIFGLGDAVATVAEPIRRALHMRPCRGCGRRKRALNRAVPNIIPPFLRDKATSSEPPKSP